MDYKVLIVEDEPRLRQVLVDYFLSKGDTPFSAPNGLTALEIAENQSFDGILLDIMMPGLDGWEVCHSIRKESTVPVIMLTARGETADKVTGLELGADDYIVKPFEMTEVIARVNAVLRRYLPPEPANDNDKCIIMDKLVINMESYQLTVDGESMDIPPKEIELLFFLAKNSNRVYTRDQLLDQVWGFEYFGDTRTVDVHVKRLREKLKNVSEKWALKTVWGVGYKFEVKG